MIIFPGISDAHTGVAGSSSFFQGVLHPFTGVDHLIAMVAVGLWATQMSGKAIWVLPVSFVSVMIVGGLMGISGVHIPFVEAGILGSILLLGALIASATKVSVASGSLIVSIVALFHGDAHGAEMSGELSVLPYIAGFILATILLHVAGISGFQVLKKLYAESAARFAGGAIALAGVYLAMA